MERDASEHVDPAAVRLADLVLVGEEAHAKQRLEVTRSISSCSDASMAPELPCNCSTASP
jgi:hypothetical protein